MTTVDTIAQAIKEKKALEFAYHGFDRVVVPYACGLTPTNEIKMIGLTENLRFYTAADIAGVAFSDAAYREATEEDKAVFAQLSKIYEQI